MTLRPARSEDAPRLGTIKRAAFDPDFLALTIWRSPDSWVHFADLCAGPPLLWVAHSGDEIVGYVHAVPTPASWHLNDIAVAPEAQGEGVGAALLARFEAIAATSPRPRQTLDVDLANPVGKAWYERHGFTPEAARVLSTRPNRTPDNAPTLRGVGYEGLDTARDEERRRGFSRAWLLAEPGPTRIGFGLLAGDAIRIDLADLGEGVAAELATRFPDRPLLVTTSGPGEANEAAPCARTILRMERSAP